MTIEHITIEGMHCDACERTITRSLAKAGVTVRNIAHNTGRATIEHDGVGKDVIRRAIQDKGYKLVEKRRENRFALKRSVEERAPPSQNVEGTILANGFLTLVILLLAQALLIFGIYALFPGYKARYFLPLLYIPVVIVTNMIALWHQRAYARDVSCMTGMMVGMTIGMATGFGIGAIVGLTNGMFVGSLVGTLAGIIAGVYAGKCCGTMGMMEGMMAGLMSGTMGAMLTVMMINDHVEWFLPILIIIDTIILAGMMRMTVEEHADSDIEAKAWPMSAVLAISFLVMTLITLIIMIAPKSAY
jgi:cation transport ATPase